MGCCPSKCSGATSRKEDAATTAEVAPILPPTVSTNQVELVVDKEVEEILMDRGDGTPMDKSEDEEPGPEEDDDSFGRIKGSQDQTESLAKALDEVLVVRVSEKAVAVQSPPSPPPRKSSRCADDIPISSTYHRAHSAEVVEQEAKRQEELRLEAEQRAREVREYKAGMQIA